MSNRSRLGKYLYAVARDISAASATSSADAAVYSLTETILAIVFEILSKDPNNGWGYFWGLCSICAWLLESPEEKYLKRYQVMDI